MVVKSFNAHSVGLTLNNVNWFFSFAYLLRPIVALIWFVLIPVYAVASFLDAFSDHYVSSL